MAHRTALKFAEVDRLPTGRDSKRAYVDHPADYLDWRVVGGQTLTQEHVTAVHGLDGWSSSRCQGEGRGFESRLTKKKELIGEYANGGAADTAEFAVESIRRWWNTLGKTRFPVATTLTITADEGGSNGYRVRAWKAELAKLAAETGHRVTVLHYPPGTSKWNRIEHRLFSFISINWRGRPLTESQYRISNPLSATRVARLVAIAALSTDERGDPDSFSR